MAKNDSQDLPFHPDVDSEDEIGLTQTQFVDDPEGGPLFEAKAILKEKADKYLVDWFGVDEKGKAWKPTWEPKTNCTNALIKEWKRSQTETKNKKKEAKKVRKDQASTANGSAPGRKRKRSHYTVFNTSEPTSQASSSTVKKPRASTGKKAAPPSASSSTSASTQRQQLRFQSTPSRTSSVASGTTSNKKTRGSKAAEEDEYEEDDKEQEQQHQDHEEEEEEEEEEQESPRRRSTYSRRKTKTALFVKPKTKAVVVDSDEDIEDAEEPSQDVEVVIGSSSDVGKQDEDEEEEEEEEEEVILKAPKKKRVRPNFKKPVPPKSKPTKSSSITVSDDDEAEKDKLPQKKRARKGRKSAPSSTAATASREEDEESQETEVVPATPPLVDGDAKSSSQPGDAREEELLSTVHEEEDPDETMNDGDYGLGGDQDDGKTFGYRDEEEEGQQPVPGPSGNTGADKEQEEEPSQEADTSRGTIIPDSQQQGELSSSHPSPLPSAEAALENSNSQFDELEESSQEERANPARAKPTTSRLVKPLGEYSPSRIQLLAEQEPEPLSSQVEEFTSSSLEDTSVGAKKRKGKKKTSDGASSRKSNGHVSTSSTTTNAEAGPSRSRRQQQQLQQVGTQEDEEEEDDVIYIASSVEEDEVVEEEPIVAAEDAAPPATGPPPPPIIITSGTESIISSFSSSIRKPVSAPATVPSSPSAINAAKSSLKSMASLAPPLSRSLDDDLLKQALLPSGSNSTATSATTNIASAKSLDSSKPMVPLSSIRKQFSFSNAAASVEDPVASLSGRRLNGGEAALRAIEKAMRADALNGAGELREGSSRSEEDWLGNEEDCVLPPVGPDGENMDEEVEVAVVEEEEEVGGEMDVDDDAILDNEAPVDPSTPVRAVRDKGKSREGLRPIVSEETSSRAGFVNVNLQEDDELALLPASPTKSSASEIPNPTLESQTLLRLQTAEANERNAKSLLISTQSMLTDTQSALTSAEAQITHLSARVVSAGEERDFVKSQYTESSNHAARFARELRTAEELVAKLQKQVDVGLRQQQAIQDARVSKITEERDQLASTVRLLNDQRRATDDVVRAKAARVPGLEKLAMERENWAAEQEDLKEIAREELDKLQRKFEQLRRRKDGNGNAGGLMSSIPVTIPRRPAATSSASASESSSEDDDQEQQQQPRPQQHQNQQSPQSSSSLSSEEEDQEEGEPFSSQNFDDDDDENGSESGDEFKPNNVPRRGTKQSPPNFHRQSSRSTQQQDQAQTLSQPSTVPFSQQTTLPSSSQDHGPPAFQRPPAATVGEDTDSDSSSDSSGVVLVSSWNKKGNGKEVEEQSMEFDEEPLLPSQGGSQSQFPHVVEDQEMEEQERVPMPLEMVICRWREEPRVECGAAFATLEAMTSHYDVVHLI